MTEDERNALTDLRVSVGRIESALIGNGTKGLGERMGDSEDWQEKHEDSHKAYREDQHAYRIKRELKEKDDAKKKNTKAWAFVGSIVLIIVGQFLVRLL